MARKSKTYQPRAKLSREQLRVIFRNHDMDNDGRLSTTELTEAFHYIGAFLPSYRARHALLHADSDRDGFIGEKDFESLVNYAEQRDNRSKLLRIFEMKDGMEDIPMSKKCIVRGIPFD